MKGKVIKKEVELGGKKIVTIFLSDDFTQLHEDGTFVDDEKGFEELTKTLHLIANKLSDYNIIVKPHPSMSKENLERLLKYYA